VEYICCPSVIDVGSLFLWIVVGLRIYDIWAKYANIVDNYINTLNEEIRKKCIDL